MIPENFWTPTPSSPPTRDQSISESSISPSLKIQLPGDSHVELQALRATNIKF